MANDLLRGRQTAVSLTNKSGGGVVAGDVVVLDSSNDSAFTTTTTAQAEVIVGVALETIANNASGRICLQGYVPLVSVPASVTRGHYLETHTVAKQAVGNSARRAGSFGRFLTGGTTPSAILGGLADQTASGGGSGAPTTATYVTEDADATLSAEVLTTTLIATGAHSSRPAATKAGRLYLPTDAMAVSRDDGSAQRIWGPIFALTPPVDGDFAWINQGSATVTASKDAIYLATPGATTNFRIRKKAAPSTPYTITAAFLFSMEAQNFNSFGLVHRQSSDGKLVFFGLASNTTIQMMIQKYTNPTTFSATSKNINWAGGTPLWLQLADDGTNRTYSMSGDGQNWRTFFAEARTTFLTADEVGFCVATNNGTGQTQDCTLVSWKQA